MLCPPAPSSNHLLIWKDLESAVESDQGMKSSKGDISRSSQECGRGMDKRSVLVLLLFTAVDVKPLF